MKTSPWILIPASLWVSFFFVGCLFLPLTALISLASKQGSGAQSLLDPAVLSVVGFTLKQSVFSTFFSVLIGFPLGIFCGRRPHRSVQTLLALPYGIPSVVVALAVTSWLGKSGLLAGLGWGYSLRAVILAHVILNAPWIALWISQARSQIPAAQLEASRTLGARSWERLKWVEWPHLKWSLFSSGVQVFSLCVMSFALVLILGGGPPIQTLETEIYSRIRLGSLDIAGAAACAFWQLVLTLLPWAALSYFSGKSLQLETFASQQDSAKNKTSVISTLLASAFLLPYLTLFRWETFHVWSSPEFLQDISSPLAVSLRLAFAVAAVTLLTSVSALVASRTLKSAELIFSLPAGISILVLGLGFWLAYGKWIDPFEGSFFAMLALQTALAFPYAYRSLWTVAQGTQKTRLEAALTLGASSFQAFMTVEWPRWRGPIFKVAAVVAGASLGEVAAVSLFYSEKLVPIPLLISRWMGQYRFGEAQALAVFLLILCLALMTSAASGSSFFRKSELQHE